MFELPRSVVALFDDERRDCITGNRQDKGETGKKYPFPLGANGTG